MALRIILADPMLRMLAGATVLAAILPAAGTAREVAQTVANVAIFVLFLLNGMRIARREILDGLVNSRFLVSLTIWIFGAMALAGWAVAQLAGEAVPPLIALGFLYLGTLPSTVQSATSYTSLAGGRVALSVISAALVNILGVFVSVPIFVALGGNGAGSVGSDAVVKILAILVLPFVIGQLAQQRGAGFIAAHKHRIVWIDRFIIAIAVYVAFSGAVEQGIWSRVAPVAWLAVAALVATFLAIGHGGAWLVAGALGLPRADRIAFLFAGAQKSAAVGAPLATILFPPAVAGFVVVPLLLYHLFQLVLAAPLASRLAARPRPDGGDCSAPTRRG